ncbi:MAG: sigma-54 dependent transcriptional regulator [Pseudomonadota bacterium]
MPSRHPRVLIVEDVPSLAQTYKAYLKTESYAVDIVSDGTSALALISAEPPDVLVLDINLPDMTGLDILRKLGESQVSTQVVVITSNGSINVAVEAMRLGAFDFIVKPFTADRLRITVGNALERVRLSETVTQLKEEFGRESFHGFIGNSLSMQAVYGIIRSAATSRATVFITGESGTGKEVCAEALHASSKRAGKPFVALNCAAIPRDLLESELFGHVKGAFTGASTDRIGAALTANGGTLFLDEIGEMDLSFQAKMLRFLETGSVQRVGEDRPQPCDVRIVCATNRDPFTEVAEGRFREDLFYRLHVIPLELPALKERDGDVLLLAEHFLDLFSKEDDKTFEGFAPDAQDALVQYSWPGNVRQLKNVIRKVVVLNEGGLIRLADLPLELQSDETRSAGQRQQINTARIRVPEGQIQPLEDQIDAAIDGAIAACGGSIPKAAAALKVSPSTLYRRLNSRGNRNSERLQSQG